MLASKASREVMERRKKLTSEFTDWRTGLLSRHSADKAKRDKLRGMFSCTLRPPTLLDSNEIYKTRVLMVLVLINLKAVSLLLSNSNNVRFFIT